MSDLGNKVNQLRKVLGRKLGVGGGTLTLEDFADAAGVSLAGVANIENGKKVRLDTVLTIAKNLKLSDDETTDLILGWIRLQLGEHAKRFWIDTKKKSDVLKDEDNLPAQIMELVSNLPTRHQKELLKALQRPPVISGIAHLNDLHDKVVHAASNPKG